MAESPGICFSAKYPIGLELFCQTKATENRR